jgi:hypothetical protein
MKANDVGGPTFDGNFVNDPGPLSRRNGGPTGRLITEDDLVTKTLRERCVNKDVKKMIGSIENWANVEHG